MATSPNLPEEVFKVINAYAAINKKSVEIVSATRSTN